MNKLEKLEKRWIELCGKPKTAEEIEEVFRLNDEIDFERSKEYSDMILVLREKRIFIDSIWDLVNTNKSYPDAIDILVKYLPKLNHDRNKEGFIRALAVKEAIGKVNSVLISEYNKTPKENKNLRWVIGNTIKVTITKSDVESIISIVQNKENGESRDMFVVALGKIKSEKIEEVLINLLDDDEVASSALVALKKLKSNKIRNKVMELLNHPNSIVREEAKKTLIKLDSIKV